MFPLQARSDISLSSLVIQNASETNPRINPDILYKNTKVAKSISMMQRCRIDCSTLLQILPHLFDVSRISK